MSSQKNDLPTPDLGCLDLFDPWNREDMWARPDEPRDEVVDRYRRDEHVREVEAAARDARSCVAITR